MRRTGELLPKLMRQLEAVWPEVATDMNIRASVAPLLLEIASAHVLDEVYTRRLQRKIEELEALQAETPTATVSVTNVFQTINNITVNDHHVTINDTMSVTDATTSNVTVNNPPPEQRFLTIERAILILGVFLTLLQTYAAFRPDDPPKPVPTQDQPVKSEDPGPPHPR